MEFKGIDVSEHNGVIDWDKVKASGIYFAMLRLGYGHTHVDTQFERNVKECERLGIKWGCYLYGYALTVDGAKDEAEFVLKVLKGRKCEFPVAYDMEDADGYKAKNGMPSNQVVVDICYNFLASVESKGYYVSLYANLSWLNNQLRNTKLDRFDKWVAQWNSKCDYKGVHKMWQSGSNGRVNGVAGNVDMDTAYSNFWVGKGSVAHVTPRIVTYKVKGGDTLSAIALSYHVTVDELMKLNPSIRDRNHIYIGQVIRVK